MRHVAETTNSSVLDLNTKIAWPLAHTYGNTFQAFRAAIADSDKVFGGLDVQPNVLAAILSNIRRKLTPQPIKIRADIEVTCFKYEGVDAIRAALQAGEAVGTEECPVKIKLIAPPLHARHPHHAATQRRALLRCKSPNPRARGVCLHDETLHDPE